MSTTAISFVDFILIDFDHAGPEQFAESDVIRLLIIGNCSNGSIDGA